MSKWFAELAGPVTPKEAHEALVRFTNSHFHNHGKEHARASIPANPKRDDDLRLGAFIAHVEQLLTSLETMFETDFSYEGCQEVHKAITNLRD